MAVTGDRRTPLPPLMPGEQVLWAGAPEPSYRPSSSDGCRLVFMVAWTGFAVFWTLAALAGGAGIFSLVGMGFVAFGTWGLVAPYVTRNRLSRTATYAVTTRRIIAATPKGGFEFPVAGTELTYLREGGLVSVRFGPALDRQRGVGVNSWASLGNQFLCVADEAGLRAALDAARGAGDWYPPPPAAAAADIPPAPMAPAPPPPAPPFAAPPPSGWPSPPPPAIPPTDHLPPNVMPPPPPHD